jgi:4-amino-4-deoxy-L-arabinose transferase-like glycosyltransferase
MSQALSWLENERATASNAAPGWRWDAGCAVALAAMSLLVGLLWVDSSGPQWPDGPRYANGGAMIHDWLLSGEWTHPYDYATRDYLKYPGFSIPYHPPAYPAMLGTWFLITGISYESARCFIALWLAVAAISFFLIQRELGFSRLVAAVASAALIFTPEVVRWSRCTMSEIPAMGLMLAATWLFLLWLRRERRGFLIAALVLAAGAFFSKITSVGMMASWFLLLASRSDRKRLLSPTILIGGVVLLTIMAVWVKFVMAPFSTHEMSDQLNTRVPKLSWENLSYYPSLLPQMLGWPAFLMSMTGLAMTLCWYRASRAHFWLFWVLGYFIFQLGLAMNEQRYFTFAMPGLIGLAAAMADMMPRSVWSRAELALVANVAIGANILSFTSVSHGIVGYETVARTMAALEEPGNVLLASWADQDFIFRYRAQSPVIDRRMLRSDRVLAIRVSDYAGIAPKSLASTAEDVVEKIRQGRIRYVITCAASNPTEDRPADLALADQAMRQRPRDFELVETFPFTIEWTPGQPRATQVFIWRYRGELPPGESDLPAVVPTANLEIKP